MLMIRECFSHYLPGKYKIRNVFISGHLYCPPFNYSLPDVDQLFLDVLRRTASLASPGSGKYEYIVMIK